MARQLEKHRPVQAFFLDDAQGLGLAWAWGVVEGFPDNV
jgi:hypothetical protein